MAEDVFGIDLGTTNSCIAQFDGHSFRVIPIDKKNTVPSILAYDGSRWCVGQTAANFGQVRPDHMISSFKRWMGDTTKRYQVADTELTPVECSTKVLAYLKEKAQAAIDGEVRNVVITVPAWFDDRQRRATLEAGNAAGFNVLRIVNEPTAAALIYDNKANMQQHVKPLPIPAVKDDQAQAAHWLVYDLGGGTFDVSVLQCQEGIKEVLASSGNVYLGGDDFDEKIVNWLLEQVRLHFETDLREDPLAMARLRLVAEQAKIKLSTETVATIEETLEIHGTQKVLRAKLRRDEFEDMIGDQIQSTLDKTLQALEEANVQPDSISRLLLVGGSTRIPLVARSLTERFGLEPEGFVDQDLSVALGAAVQAAICSNLDYSQIIVDVSPHTLGIAAMGNEDLDDDGHMFLSGLVGSDSDPGSIAAVDRVPKTFCPIIRRNSRLPARHMERYWTSYDDQDQVEVAVFQGESKNTRENLMVGSFLVDIPPRPSPAPVHIGFEYDLNGVVRIFVSEDGEDHKNARRYVVNVSNNQKIGSGNLKNEPTANAEQKGATNFLIEKVEATLEERGDSDGQDLKIKNLLADYRTALQSEDDSKLDDLEDELYGWLESNAPVDSGRPPQPLL